MTHLTTPLNADVELGSNTAMRFLLPLLLLVASGGCSAGTTAAAFTAADASKSPFPPTLTPPMSSPRHAFDDAEEDDSFLRPLVLRAGIVHTPFSDV